MTVVLHDYWRSSASYRVRIALALKGIAYERVTVDLVGGAQRSPENLRINPQGLVPVLEIDGLVLTQSLAMLEYLEETRPQPAILPADPALRARARAISLAVACEIHPVSNLGVLSRVESLAGAEARSRWNRENIRAGLRAIEGMLRNFGSEGRFCCGETPTIADCTLIPQLYNAARWDVERSDLPRLSAIEQACAGHAAFAAAHPSMFEPDAIAAAGR